MKSFEVRSIPNKYFSREVLLEAMGNTPFLLFYDIKEKRCSLIFDYDKDKASLISNSIGISLEEGSLQSIKNTIWSLSLYRKLENIPENFMSDLYDFNLDTGFICISFVVYDENGVKTAKGYIEKELHEIGSRRNINFTKSELGRRFNEAIQMDIFENSEDTALLKELLDSLNDSLSTNGKAYKILFFTDSQILKDYLLSKFVLFSSNKINIRNVEDLIKYTISAKCLPFGSRFASKTINFYGNLSINYAIATQFHSGNGDIELGSFQKNAITDTDNKVMISKSTLNLGAIISGLPGSGKTREAMAILDQIKNDTMIFVIAPTDEWKGFALSHNMHYIRICDDSIPINLFRCPKGANISSFYQNLAMILSSASAAGPYRNPMEKCMLNAFRRVYSSTDTPDPVLVYEEIENSIVKMHARKTNYSIKYTKHGENIKSALENLVFILNYVEYSEKMGVLIEDMADNGIVFDLSNAGASTRSYFYALILNQIYSMASQLDSNGDDSLKLVICLEEAQLIFKDPTAASVEDIKQRMQDFRKKGIGLILLTHNVSDIESGIRRLCQTKIYLKQASDVAQIAARDLVFTFADDDDAVSKLKHLDSRVGALCYVGKYNGIKTSNDTIFIKTKEYDDAAYSKNCITKEYVLKKNISISNIINSRIKVFDNGTSNKIDSMIIRYMGEEKAEFPISDCYSGITYELVENRRYCFELLDNKKRIVERYKLFSAPEILIPV